MSVGKNFHNYAWKSLTESNQKHLCFGFVRKWLHLMNIDIQVDDIANIIFNYALSLNFGFIHNPNYSNVFFTDYKSNKSDNDTNYNSSKSAVTSPFITCNFNIDPRKIKANLNDNTNRKIDTTKHKQGHFASSVIFKPFLSKLLNIDEKNLVTHNHKSIRMNVILQHKNCKSKRFANSGYKLQCGLIAVPKKEIFNFHCFKPKNNIDDIDINNGNYYNCQHTFFDQFEKCFSQKVMFYRDHSMVVSVLPQKLHDELNNCKDDDDSNCNCNNIINTDNMIQVLKSMCPICIAIVNQYGRCRCACQQPSTIIKKKNETNGNGNDVGISYAEYSDNFLLTGPPIAINDDHDQGTNGSQFILKENDCMQLCVEYQSDDNEYTIDVKRAKAKDVLKNDFDKGKSLLGEKDVGKFECRKLNFDKYDYLLAIASARCVCKDVQGFQVQVFVEQFDTQSKKINC